MDILTLMGESNSENNVTAQVFVPLVHSPEGKRLLGQWLTTLTTGVAVQGATFFWFPLREAIANYFYNSYGRKEWDGYKTLFDALGLPPSAISSLLRGHPKSPAWGPERKKNFYAEVVAELASTEFDAVFDIETSGRRYLFLMEAKWLSPFGAGRRGLNQVQHSVALGKL